MTNFELEPNYLSINTGVSYIQINGHIFTSNKSTNTAARSANAIMSINSILAFRI